MYQSFKEKANRVADVICGKTGQVVGTVGGSLVAGSASAAPVDLTTLTAAVDFSTATTAILATAAIMVGVYVAWKAAKMVIAAVKGL